MAALRPGYNPTRRNRNIGTAKQGHGQDNRLRIPSVCLDFRSWYNQLGPHRRVRRTVLGRKLLFIVEETHGGCTHACTIDDICWVLGLTPFADWDGLDTFLLRQPKRKERVLSPVWGRLAYTAFLGMPGQPDIRTGPTVTLEAFDGADIVWSNALGPDSAAELARLEVDGHTIRNDGRNNIIASTPDTVRATQLYRTLLHEIGHWVDWQEKVLRPEQAGGDYDALSEAYFARPGSEREAFAHRYADRQRAQLFATGNFPFERVVNHERLAWDGLLGAWFGIEPGTDRPG